jgi:hypothetical protein
MKVFMSYSRLDGEFVDRLQATLTARGFDVWTDVGDMDKMSEEDWRDAVVNEISATDVMVLVLSPDSVTSDSVKQEMTVAKADKKRIVPILYRECELRGAFKYVLLNKHYIDFVKYGFEEGVDRLTTRLGLATTKDNGIEKPEGTNGDGHNWRTVALAAGGVALLVAVVVLAVALTSESPPPEQEQEQEQARQLVTDWADSTTNRDFIEASRIDPAHSPEYLEMLYRPADDPVRMISVQPYIADATQEGSLWRLEGAAMALDFNPEPTIRTHVICSEWMVDVEAGTATWTEGTDEFFEGQQIPSEEFAATYEAVCT